jgi:hypothetical protein
MMRYLISKQRSIIVYYAIKGKRFGGDGAALRGGGRPAKIIAA